jgi:hypothetical protein
MTGPFGPLSLAGWLTQDLAGPPVPHRGADIGTLGEPEALTFGSSVLFAGWGPTLPNGFGRTRLIGATIASRGFVLVPSASGGWSAEAMASGSRAISLGRSTANAIPAVSEPSTHTQKSEPDTLSIDPITRQTHTPFDGI